MVANTTTANNTHWASSRLEVPLLNLPNTGGQAKSIELISVDVTHVGNTHDDIVYAIGALNLSGVQLTEYSIAAAFVDKRIALCGRTGTSATILEDLTDDNGNGILYPAQSLYVNIHSTANAARTMNFRIMYRIVSTNMTEYVGIMNQYVVTQ